MPRTLSLRAVLVASFTALVIGAVGTLAAVWWYAGERALATMAGQPLTRIDGRIDQRWVCHLSELPRGVESNAAQVRWDLAVGSTARQDRPAPAALHRGPFEAAAGVRRGEPSFAAVQPLAGLGPLPSWLLVVMAPARDFAALIQEQRRQLVLFGALASMIAVLAGLAMARWISRPVLALHAAIGRLADGDFSQTPPPTRVAELRDLGDALGSLARRLQVSFTSLSNVNEGLRRAEARFHVVFEQSPLGVALLDLDSGEVLEINDRLVSMLGRGREECLNAGWQGLTHPDDLPAEREQIARMQAGAIDKFDLEKRFLRPDGGHLWAHLTVAALGADPHPRRLHLALVEDISGRKLAEAAVRDSEERFRSAFANANTGMCLVDLQGRFLQANDRMGAIFGYHKDELVGLSVNDLAVPEDAAISMEVIARALDGEVERATFEKRYRHRRGHVIHGQVATSLVRDQQGRPSYFISQVQDITDRKLAEEALVEARDQAERANRALTAANAELHRLATTDSLTGLWNRRQLETAAGAAIARAQRSPEPLSLILFDIDHFKSLNDRHGHQAGDRVLMEVARRVRGRLRQADMLARWGGEEFLALLPGCDAGAAERLAQALVALIGDEPFDAVGRVTGSFGVAELRPGEGFDACVKRADKAMYRAKAAGRNAARLADCD